jgi:hypothetical protein
MSPSVLPVHHARSQHIDVKFHWLREQVLAGTLRVDHVDTDKQKADVLTKPKAGDAFHHNALELVTDMQTPKRKKLLLPISGCDNMVFGKISSY